MSMRIIPAAVRILPVEGSLTQHSIIVGMSLTRLPTKETSAFALFMAFLRLTLCSTALSPTSVPSACFASVESAASLAVRLLWAASVWSTEASSDCNASCQNSMMEWESDATDGTDPLAERLRFAAALDSSASSSTGALGPASDGCRRRLRLPSVCDLRWRARRRISSPP